jgi:hypothetical protein
VGGSMVGGESVELHVIIKGKSVDQIKMILDNLEEADLIDSWADAKLVETMREAVAPWEESRIMKDDNTTLPATMMRTVDIGEDIARCVDCDNEFSVVVMTMIKHPQQAEFYMCQSCWTRMVTLALKGQESDRPGDNRPKGDVMGSQVTVKGPTGS